MEVVIHQEEIIFKTCTTRCRICHTSYTRNLKNDSFTNVTRQTTFFFKELNLYIKSYVNNTSVLSWRSRNNPIIDH
jgi:hypothetical protein